MSGNLGVKVAVRVRPVDNKTEKDVIDVIEEKIQIVVKEDNYNFTFDHVFCSKAAQNEVYNQSVKPLINNILKVSAFYLKIFQNYIIH